MVKLTGIIGASPMTNQVIEVSGPSLMVKCPTCGSQAGYGCLTVDERRWPMQPHAGRMLAYSLWKDQLGGRQHV